MKTKLYSKCSYAVVVILLLTTSAMAQMPTIKGPADLVTLMPATLGNGVTPGQVYTTETGMTGYSWKVSGAGMITAGKGTNSITVTWTNPTGQQYVSVTYNESVAATPTVLVINYYPFPAAIDPAVIPQFVDPLPHFAAGLRVDAKKGGNLLIRTFPVRQIALSTGTPLATGVIGSAPEIGMGNYAGYGISTNNGVTFGPAMWPAQTIETRQGFPLQVKYENGLAGITYDHFNILADQTLMMNGFKLNGDPKTEPYRGDIPMVVHLHGGEMPSGSDGGPSAWFTPGFKLTGPAFQTNSSSLSTYPNQQEATTLWYHPHDDGLTRINVYTGLAGYYILRGADEEAAKLPGWSGDDKVLEITPAGRQPVFNGPPNPIFSAPTAYLPEVEIAIQDRMFNVEGGLFWPVAPPNPEIHPFWTPEFVGDVMTVNGKSWPYLSVAPRKYRFRMLEGCNARFLNMWLAVIDPATGKQIATGPKFTVIGGEGGLLATPVDLDPEKGQTLLMAPGQRYDVIVDFEGIAPGTIFTLMNDAGSPYPDGDPVIPGITDRIMQFVVNGKMVSAADPKVNGKDNSKLPDNLRPVTPLVKLTDFAGKLSNGVVPVNHRQLVLNEVSADGGPAAVLINNSYFESVLSINPNDPYRAGGPSEIPLEGTTEKFSIINISADAHPIHIHLLQWQLVSRQTIDANAYLDEYAKAWADNHPGVAEFPAGLGYPGGAGTPFPYSTVNGDGAIGGNPAIPSALLGPVIPARPEEMGWKDDVIVMPGEVTTFVVRVAPTDRPINASAKELMFPFDPSEGPGYVWHCHIVDHEDMSMMRPLPIAPSPLRYPQIGTQPSPAVACVNDAVTFSVAATSATTILYKWQVSNDQGATFTDLTNTPPYSGALSSSLKISPATLPLSGKLYRCILNNFSGETISVNALLTVNNCSVSGILRYNNATLDPLAGFSVTIKGLTSVTDANGAFRITGIGSGTYPVIVRPNNTPAGGVNSSDAGSVKAWIMGKVAIPNVRLLSGDVNNDLNITKPDAVAIENKFVKLTPFQRTPWVFWGANGSGVAVPQALTVDVKGAPVTGFDILALSTGDFNESFEPNANNGNSLVQLTQSGNTLTFRSFKLFDLPLKTVTDIQTGAISLILNVPSNLVKVMGVKVPGSNQAVTWRTIGNELRIGWNSVVPVSKDAGDDLVVITMLPTVAFTDIQTLTVGLVPNSLNEIADSNFDPIINAELTTDQVEITPLGIPNPLKLKAEPNPATVNTTITYVLPVAGKVNLGIYNALGTPVRTIVGNVTQDAGTYTLNTDVSSLRSGFYYVRITLKNNTQYMVKAIILVKR